MNEAVQRSEWPLKEVGATAIEVKRCGESIRIWFVTEDGRQISLCNRGLTEGLQITIALDPYNVRLKTWHKHDDSKL